MTEIERMRIGLTGWYPFRENADILCIGDWCMPVYEYLTENGRRAKYVSQMNSLPSAKGKYDYAILVEDYEKSENPDEVFGWIADLLEHRGVFLLGTNNRLGIRYFCGDRDLYTDRTYDGVENYINCSTIDRGRMYSKSEIYKMLDEAGFHNRRCYSVFSDLEHPFHIFAEDYLSDEDLVSRITPTYHYPGTVFLEEEQLYKDLLENDMFHQMSNAYLVECSKAPLATDVACVTGNTDRDRENAIFTIIFGRDRVIKKPVFAEGRERINNLQKNNERLAEAGLPTITSKIEGNTLSMPFMTGITGQKHLYECIRKDVSLFLKEMDRFMDHIRMSSEIVRTDQNLGPILERGYIDMVPLNTIYHEGVFLFFDQEFEMDDYPLEAIMARAITTFYAYHNDLERILSQDRLFERYGLLGKRELLETYEKEFLDKLWQEDRIGTHKRGVRRNMPRLKGNRNRNNYPFDEYLALHAEPFRDLDKKKIVLFGAGKYAKFFINRHGSLYEIAFIVDNDNEKWDTDIDGIKICPPDILNRWSGNDYIIFVCMKNYKPVFDQLHRKGIFEYYWYDINRDYGNNDHLKAIRNHKAYHIGYVAGAFDMFHTGHLNLLRRARERCDYLVAGVMSDARIYQLKHKYPVISYDERVQVVEGCRYVDEVIDLPVDNAGIRDAYERVHFDCMFSGDDHADNPEWLSEQAYLRSMGSDIVFVPYTREVSSTEIREKVLKQKVENID